MKLPLYIRLRNKISPTQTIFLGFIGLILIGALILCLPICHSGNQDVSFFDALFTSTSASCVTGLVVKDTNTTWSPIGKFIILLLIQIGGLGIMTIFSLFFLVSKKKMNLKERLALQESINSTTLSGTVKLFSKILITTLSFELIGAILLFSQFKNMFELKDAAIKSIFHSISAFCNAGFDILGTKTSEFQSLITLNTNPIILLTLSSLIVIGGLGFIVWKDIWKNKFNFKKYTLHSKIVIISTTILIILGAILFNIFEHSNINTIGNMTNQNQITNSLFHSITTRTAGFSSLNINSMNPVSNFITIILMLIGVAPGSTGGGIKVTTISILILSCIFFISGKEDVQVMKNSIPRQIIYKAFCIFMIAIFLVIVGTVIILVDNPGIALLNALFEVSSALSTCGLSTGITPSLNIVSKFVLILFMFFGRIGPLTAVIAFSHRQKLSESTYKYADGKISVG